MRVFPEEVATEPTARLAQLEDAVEVLFADDARGAEILRCRLGLQKVLPQTLESVGERFGVTRERIRQIEAGKLARVRTLFLRGSVNNLELHPDLHAFAKELHSAASQSARCSVMTVDDFKRNMRDQVGIAPPLRKGLMRVFLEWNEVLVHSPRGDDRAFVFHAMSPVQRLGFCKQLSGLEKALRTRLEPLAVEELVHLSLIDLRGLKMTALDLVPLFEFEPEWLSDGVFQVPLEYLRGRANQAVRILSEWGESLHYREIAERIRQAEGQGGPDDNNLRNQMSTDERLRPVGRSGLWVLAEWEHIDTDSIKDVIAKVLSESDRPLSRDEILEAVQLRRPCSETSIDIYLTSTPEFLLVAHDLYRYCPGASAGDSWNRETLGQWIETYFAENPGSVRTKTLASAFEARAGLKARRLASVMGRHPALISHRDRSGRVYVSLRTGWREYSRAPRARDGLGSKVDVLLEDLFVEGPHWPLNDVVNLLSEELGSPPSSLYSYIRSSSVCATYDEQGQKWICRPGLAPAGAENE